MYEQAQEMLAEPAIIKMTLPLAYVAEKYGVRLIAGEGRLSGICPFHTDHDPSFDIYPWGNAERFGCFACGAGGDVLDFIQRMSGIGFRDACEAAKRAIMLMEQENWTAPALQGRFEWDEAAARDLMRRAGTNGIEQLIAAKGWKFTAGWLVSQFDCRTMGDQLLVPFWTEDRRLVGVKHRSLSGARSPITLPGSRLRSTLYGIQRVDVDCLLLCEGESDVWTASYALAQRAIVPVGLPAGAGAAPSRLDLFVGRRVIIAFDGDEAGRMSAARWAEAVPHAIVWDLPDGHDITSVEAAHPGWLQSKLEESC